MGDESGVLGAGHAAANGAATNGNGRPASPEGNEGAHGGTDAAGAAGSLIGAAAGLAARAASPVLRRLAGRLTADLDDRDPDYIREKLPTAWLMASLWFRGEVRGMENIPEDGPVLLVGNHSGGNMTPDTLLLSLSFSSYFGVERPFYQLAHNLVLASPYGQILRKFGTVAASHENAHEALRSGAALLVYPGGDWEVHRSILDRNVVEFHGRKGFIRLALEENVPIVPVVSIGGQETSIFLSRGDHLARALRLDKLFRLKVLPISLALPWGINIGDFLGHVPLPAKLTVDIQEPIYLQDRFGRKPDLDEVYEHITELMQDTLDVLAAERRFPIIG
jgi:1-acyl-sn-glycerol-3-phosphate acyltransferase